VKKNHSNKNSHWKMWLIGLAIVAVVVLAVLPSSKQQPTQVFRSTPPLPQSQEVTFNFSVVEAKQLTNELLTATYPPEAGNSYFTPLMREKLMWVADEKRVDRLLLSAVGEYSATKSGVVQKGVLMASNYTSANRDNKPPYKPYIEIYTPRLLMLVRVQQKVPTGFNQMCKNTFALGLVHEAVHLERESKFYTVPHSDEQNLLEEERTWLKVDMGAVRQLRAMGQPLDTDYLESDDIMKRCGYKRGCPEFLEYLKSGGKSAAYPR